MISKMYKDELKIPKERIPVLIGEKGNTRRKIENRAKVKLTINSEEGDVIINGENSFNIFIVKNIIKAVGRGFNPDIALMLLNEDYCLDIIEIKEFSGKSKNKELRIKARVIGTKGRCRVKMEQLTNTFISIYGKTIAVIGKSEDVMIARRALEQLMKGSKHGNVYRLIENMKRKLTTQTI